MENDGNSSTISREGKGEYEIDVKAGVLEARSIKENYQECKKNARVKIRRGRRRKRKNKESAG